MQAVLHDRRYGAVSFGPDVEQQVSAAAHNIREHDDEFPTGVVVLKTLGTVIPVTEAHTTALLPRVIHAGHSRCVFGSPVASVLVARVFAPAVVDDDFVFDRRVIEEPGKQFGTVPLAGGQDPLDIAEEA